MFLGCFQLANQSTSTALLGFFVTGVCFTAPLTDLKVADIESAELFCFLSYVILIPWFCVVTYSRAWNELTLRQLKVYGAFLILTFILALVATRLETFPIPDTGVFKTAPFLSFARVAQLAIDMGCAAVLVQAMADDQRFLKLLVQSYVYAGLVSAVYAIVSWLALYGGVDLGGAYIVEGPRAKGFFVEGGPFGVYLISVIAVCVFRWRVLGCSRQLPSLIQLLVLATALVLSSSKAGILLGLVLLVVFAMFAGRAKYVLGVIMGLVLVVLVFPWMLEALAGYFADYSNFEEVLASRPDDTSLMMGRIMAAILVPIMTIDHPFLGIGIGNYPLQRNNPEYLSGLPTTDLWDLPGLGLVGYAAELGIPLFLVLCWLLWKPASMARSSRAPALVGCVASYQFFAHLMGVQLTFIYPWIVSSITMGYIICGRSTQSKELS